MKRVRRRARVRRESTDSPFHLTWSSLFDAPESLHERLDAALAEVREHLGESHPILIGGEEVETAERRALCGPADTERVLGEFSLAGPAEVDAAVQAALEAFPAWARTPWPERIEILLRAAALIDESAFHLACAMSLEVGKPRLEALAEVTETAARIRWYCDRMRAENGYARDLASDPVDGFVTRNRAVPRPHGPWVVLAPFCAPFVEAGAPAAAALLAGNTVILKPAGAAPWSAWLLANCLREAGVPGGAFNLITGSGASAGDALVRHPRVAGVTFAGSRTVGARIEAAVADARRAGIARLGGINPVVVSRHADIDRAAIGIARSAWQFAGQGGYACGRVVVERPSSERLAERLAAIADDLVVGDPTLHDTAMGPVIDGEAHDDYGIVAATLRADADLLAGARILTESGLDRGHYCAPALARIATTHPLWHRAMTLPVLLLAEVDTLDEAIESANAIGCGLSAGFYGSPDETAWFLNRVHAGTVFCNRPQGATSGTWPGHQCGDGWDGRPPGGRGPGSPHYVAQYLREQSQTIVE